MQLSTMDYQLLPFPSLIIFLISAFMILRSIWKISKTRDKIKNLPPGPWKLPLIGNMHLLFGSLPHHCLRDLAKKYGPVMHLQLGEVSHIVISSPKSAKEVLKNYDIHFAQRPKLIGASVITYNFLDIAFAPYGDYWRQLRKVCTLELLSAKRVKSFQSVREDEVGNLVRSITSYEGTPINMTQMLDALTNAITIRTAFGGRCKDKAAFIPVVQKITEIVGGFSAADLFPSYKLVQVLSGMKSDLTKLHREEDRILGNIIDEHKASRKIGKTSEDDVEDLVDVLLNVQENGDPGFLFTTDNIKAVILDMFAAGTDTSSGVLEWAISELVKSPRVLKKAQAEVREVFGLKGNVEESFLHELQYFHLVIKETLRLHPPVPLLLPRECRESCKINEYNIPVGTKVIVNAWAIGRDPNYWSEPERFYPERFLNGSFDFKGNNFEYLPFGAGRRMCPGICYGMANVELTLAHLLYHFNWKFPHGMNIDKMDMAEAFGATVRRKNHLYLVPVPYSSLSSE